MASESHKEVLIIEDDDWIRNALRMILTFHDLRVVTAANGKEGLEKLESMSKPGVIVLDLMMPVMDGWAFAEELGMNVALKDVPLVVLTAFNDRAETVPNATHYMTKPIDFKALLGLVKQYCA